MAIIAVPPNQLAIRLDVRCELTSASVIPIRTALIVLAIVSTMAMPYTVLMPAFVSNVLHGGPKVLGALMTSSGVGAQ